MMRRLKFLAPETAARSVMSFCFWQFFFGLVHLGLIWAFGSIGKLPLWQNLLTGFLLCTPFLLITLLIVRQHVGLGAELRRQALIDPLTGLNNRRAFFKGAVQGKTSTSDLVIILDIDHFKRVNDTYGHMRGDICLTEVGRYLTKWVRPTDHICRYGGEEFAVVMRDIPVGEAQSVASRVAQGRVFNLDGIEVEITFSIGIAIWDCGKTLEQTLQKADAALYAAKAAGRARVVVDGDDTRVGVIAA